MASSLLVVWSNFVAFLERVFDLYPHPSPGFSLSQLEIELLAIPFGIIMFFASSYSCK